ncbi:adenylosuccinate lyase family protein [Rhodovarius crocodyli]|uniref:Adenylosuccinate lyase family protein n=1 Tax=Rhodovarius crocodyli TaxID=1979269 RepID=A0A437MFF3_9PROT|nr:adenylosuccinate lyase family protein [Rhodovarius crocodyli]RVT96356.1 adenylosuccinate lyase family protein [Rhodovarius crocodyli]
MTVNPADAPVLGALYGSDAMRAAMGERAFLARMLDVEVGLARAQARLNIIPAEAAEAIAVAADVDKLDLPALAAATRNTGYPVVGLVKQLSALAGPDAGRWTHWGATTQDIMDSAIVLQMRQGLALIRMDLVYLNTALAGLAQRWRDTPMAGRTHLQHALPVTFGYKAAVWLSPLISMKERLDQLRPRVERLQFGGAAGTLASLGDQALMVQEELGRELGLPVPDITWHVARDGFTEAVNFLGLLTGSLAKIALDVMLMSQTELGEVSEAHAPGRGGSSTMPQKRNPISCEYVQAQARGVQALAGQMMGAMAQDFERGTGNWQTELLAIGQAFNLTHGALQASRDIIEGLVVDPARMARNLDATHGLIVGEQVMMGLAPVLGRGTAHHLVNHACDKALAEGRPLAEVLLAEPAVATSMTPEAVLRLTDPKTYLGQCGAFVDKVLARLAG